MKTLVPSFAPPATWRNNSLDSTGRDFWKMIRQKILERDNWCCQYCGFDCDKWQIVHHINGNPNNNKFWNLMTVCQMCNLVEHAGFGCVVAGVVDLYKKSKFSQVDVINKTRLLRAKGKPDTEIIAFLGLEQKVDFMQDKDYLHDLIGFTSSRKPCSYPKYLH